MDSVAAPGFQLGLDIADVQKRNPQAIGTILGGHGITAWGDTSEEAEANSLEIIATAQRYIDQNGRTRPFGPPIAGYQALEPGERRAKAAALAPFLRGLASTDNAQVGHFTDDRSRPRVPLRSRASATGRAGHQLPGSLPAHQGQAAGARPTRRRRHRGLEGPAARSCMRSTARTTAAYYDRHATDTSPAMRGADPAIVLIPGVGMFSYGKDKQTARVAGEFYLNAINVMRGAEAISRYQPIDESEKFRIEYWALEEAKLARMPKPKPLATRIALVTGAASGIGKAIATRLAAEGACVMIADLDADKAGAAASDINTAIGSTDSAAGIAADVTDEAAVQAAIDATVLAFGGIDIVVNNAGLSLSKSLLDTTAADWDLQHNVMARGSFLVSRAAAKALIDQKLGGDIIYISSKNSVFAGPNNIAYSATKADQAHQVRLLAAELGEHGIKVNGINPDGVVRGSGIFAGGWGAKRAAVYGVAEDDLGAFYAQRTLLKREVLPEHVANAAFALCNSDLSHTTGLHVPVDAGVAAAFLR